MASGLNFGILDTQAPLKIANSLYEGQQQARAEQQQERANKLADLQYRGALQAEQDAAAQRAAWAGATTPEEAQKRLIQGGFGKAAMDVGKYLTDQQKSKLEQQKSIVELMKHYAGQVSADPRLPNAMDKLLKFHAATGVDVTSDIQNIAAMDDEGRRKWAMGFENPEKFKPSFHTVNGSGVTFNPMTGETKVVPGIPEKPMSEYEKGMLNARNREVTAKENKAKNPQGIDADFGLKPEKIIELRQDMGKDRASVNQITDEVGGLQKAIDRLIGSADGGKPHPGLQGITGAQYAIPDFPASPVTTGDARAARTILKELQGKTATLGRAIQSQSGKMGNLAVKEWEILRDSLANLDATSSDFPQQVKNLRGRADNLVKKVNQNYSDIYAPYLEKMPELAAGEYTSGGLKKNPSPKAPAQNARFEELARTAPKSGSMLEGKRVKRSGFDDDTGQLVIEFEDGSQVRK